MNRELAKKDLFIATTFKGCGGRVAVNHWVQEPLDQAVENFQKWFADLEIDTPPHQTVQATRPDTDTNREHRPLSIYWLASTIPPLKRDKGRIKADMDKLRPNRFSSTGRRWKGMLRPHHHCLHPQSIEIAISWRRWLQTGYDQPPLQAHPQPQQKESDMEIRPHLTSTRMIRL